MMIQTSLSRRRLMSGALALPILALPGCTTGLGGFGFVDAIRELLTLSSQRAFANLLRPNGFFDSNVARIDLPPQLGGNGASSILSRVLTSGPIKERLALQVNRAAERGAERAAPLVYDAIRTMSIADALSIVRGGPTAATGLLRNVMGQSLVSAMFPAIGGGLRLADSAVVSEALRLATGIDFNGLSRDISRKASDGIYAAIGQEEAAIRANPRSSNSALIQGVFGVL